MDTRESLRRMRNLRDGVIENFDNKTKNTEQPKKEMTMREMLALTRKVVGEGNKKVTPRPKTSFINEADMEKIDLDNDGEKESDLIDTSVDSKKTVLDQKTEEDKFRQALNRFNVNVKFQPIEILDNSVIWNGTIDNQLQWSFLVTPDETVNGAKFNYSKNFDDNNPDNEEMVDTIKKYYDDFYKYWRDNQLEK